MGKIFSQAVKPRVPEATDSIQVNFCKNPICSNYGVPASVKKQPRGPGASLRGRDSYKIQASNTQFPFLKCLLCNEHPPTKSNLAIQEEFFRLSDYLNAKEEPSCPEPLCNQRGSLQRKFKPPQASETKFRLTNK